MRLQSLRIIPTGPLAVLAIAAITLLLAACGGDSVRPTAASSQDTPTQTVATESPTQSSTGSGPPTAPATDAVAASPTLENQEPANAPTQSAISAQPAKTEESAFSGTVGGTVGDRAPEFAKIYNWINSEPLTMEELRGKVVLIDFWTYTCVNCIRTFPYLREWNEKYKDKGLAIIGVHTPEFDFEKVTENVIASTNDHNLTWPMAQDNDFGTWLAYSNRFWPAKYLIDAEGIVRYTHFGEGAYLDTEEQIRKLLEEVGVSLDDVEIGDASEPTADYRAYSSDRSIGLTRELYGGYQRNASSQGIYVAHERYYDGPSQTLNYADPGNHQNGFMYLQGPWTNGLEKLKHARETQDNSDYIGLKFFATSVNAVIDPEGGPPFDVQATIDGRPLTAEEAGADLILEDGRSFFIVDEARLFEVVALPEFGGHELKLSANSPDFAFFAFTFGAYAEGP